MHLLDHEAPGLAERLQALSLTDRRRALANATMAASRQIEGLEPSILSLIKIAVDKGELTADQLSQAREYAEAADEKYFDTQEQGASEAVWGNWFAKARLGSALVAAFADTDWQDAARAAYELCFTGDDKRANAALLDFEIDRLRNHLKS